VQTFTARDNALVLTEEQERLNALPDDPNATIIRSGHANTKLRYVPKAKGRQVAAAVAALSSSDSDMSD